MNQHTYQAQFERLSSPKFLRRMETLYREVDQDDLKEAMEQGPGSFGYANIYGQICNVAMQVLWGDLFGIPQDVRENHTSDPARGLANIMMVAIGLAPNRPGGDTEQTVTVHGPVRDGQHRINSLVADQ